MSADMSIYKQLFRFMYYEYFKNSYKYVYNALWLLSSSKVL